MRLSGMRASATDGDVAGQEVRVLRERAGVSRGEVAARAGVLERDVDAWERGAVVSSRVRHKMDHALWQLERDAVLARPDAPRCTELDLSALPRPMDKASQDALVLHLETCEACLAREPYLARHLRPEPGALPGWAGSALVGAAAVLVLMGLAPLVLSVAAAIVSGEPWWIAVALALMVVVAIAGAAGGVVHYASRGWRGRGGLGRYASWILVVSTYVAAVLAMSAAGWMLSGAPLDPELTAMVSHPIPWLAAVLTVIGWGIALGRWDRPERPPPAAP